MLEGLCKFNVCEQRENSFIKQRGPSWRSQTLWPCSKQWSTPILCDAEFTIDSENRLDFIDNSPIIPFSKELCCLKHGVFGLVQAAAHGYSWLWKDTVHILISLLLFIYGQISLILSDYVVPEISYIWLPTPTSVWYLLALHCREENAFLHFFPVALHRGCCVFFVLLCGQNRLNFLYGMS